MPEEQGIYRGEVLAMMGALADISNNTHTIVEILTRYDEENDEEDDA